MSSESLMELYREVAPHLAYLKKVKEILRELEGTPREKVIHALKEYGEKADPTLKTDIKILLRQMEKR